MEGVTQPTIETRKEASLEIRLARAEKAVMGMFTEKFREPDFNRRVLAHGVEHLSER